MHTTSMANHGILLTADLARFGAETRQIQRAAENGTLHRVRRGAYVEAAAWEAADGRERYLTRLRAVAVTRQSPPVFCLTSAAALHGLPNLGPWPTVAHVCSDSPGRSKNGVAHHLAKRGVELVTVDGLTCTSLVDTLVDLALSASFTAATVNLDHCLHAKAVTALLPNEWKVAGSPSAATAAAEFADRLRGALDRLGAQRGFRGAHRAVDFATHLSDSPGESVSRCMIHRLGFPAPELQHPFFDYRGRIGWGDFWWEPIRLLGEFDGENKYTDPVFLAGRTAEQAVIDEKWREDRIRATDASVSRWGWKTANNANALYAKLTAAGLQASARRPTAR